MLTPKKVTNSCKVKRIVVTSYYVKPGINRRKILYDHFAQTFHFLSSLYPDGLYWALCGDTNTLDLSPILSLCPDFKQVVTDPTRKDKCLDTIITNLGGWYQLPRCIPPLDVDKDKDGTASDHKMVLFIPKDNNNNNIERDKKVITYRPYTDQGFNDMKEQLLDVKWDSLFNLENVNLKLHSNNVF